MTTWRDSHVEHRLALLRHTLLLDEVLVLANVELLLLVQRLSVMDSDALLARHDVLAGLTANAGAYSTLIVLIVQQHAEVVLVLGHVDGEAWLVLLVTDTVAHPWAEHERRALHEVVHDVLGLWLERLLVDDVEVYFLVRGHLHPSVAIGVRYLPAHVLESVVPLPFISFMVNLEEHDRAAGASHERLPVDKVARAKVNVRDLLTLGFIKGLVLSDRPRSRLLFDRYAVTLTIERVTVAVLFRVEGLEREVTLGTVLELDAAHVGGHLALEVIVEMVLHASEPLVDGHEDRVPPDERHCHQRFP